MEAAVQNYKQTLALLARCQEAPEAARERVVSKLSDTLQHRLSCFVHASPKQASMRPATYHHMNGAYHRDERQQGVLFRRGQMSQKRERSLQVPRDQRLQQDRSSSTDDESSDIATPCTSAWSRNRHDKSQINTDSAPRRCGDNPQCLNEHASRQQGPAPHISCLQPTAQLSRNCEAQRQMTRKDWHAEGQQDANRRHSCSTATVKQSNRGRTGQVSGRSKLCSSHVTPSSSSLLPLFYIFQTLFIIILIITHFVRVVQKQSYERDTHNSLRHISRLPVSVSSSSLQSFKSAAHRHLMLPHIAFPTLVDQLSSPTLFCPAPFLYGTHPHSFAMHLTPCCPLIPYRPVNTLPSPV
uniref:Uncharacterized protein n=1 Tax=Eptatretus burgeri TaxID=7764 RepID=A0A8C4Q2Z5_EPTBU